MTFIPNMECLWENVCQVNHMTDGSPNFSLATHVFGPSLPHVVVDLHGKVHCLLVEAEM
jgi:hypothetical protein